MVILKRVSVGSAVKVVAIFSTLSWAIFGLLYLGFVGLVFSSMGSALSSSANQFGSNSSANTAGAFAGFGLVSLCIAYVVGLVFAVIVGAISGAIYAFIYNLTAGWVGGLEFELTRVASATTGSNLPPM